MTAPHEHEPSASVPAPRGVVSIGVAGSLGPTAIARIARATEDAGFHALWVNDTPQGDSLVALHAAAGATHRLGLCTGVIPLDRRSAEHVAEAVRAAGLPEHRVTLGLGSGASRQGSLGRVRHGLTVLRDATTATLLVGALGPKMRALAARDADGVLLNWVTPGVAAEQASEHRAIVRDAASPPHSRVVAYARTIIDAGARQRLDAEVAGYASVVSYAANFARLGIDASDTVLPRRSDDGLRAGVDAYTASVDELVLRAITPADDVEHYLDFVRRAALALAL